MLSLLKRTPHKDAADSAELVRSLSLLLEALAIQTVNLDYTEYVSFRDATRSLRRAIEEAPAQAMTIAGNVVHLLEGYNRHLEEVVQAQEKEHRAMDAALIKSVIALAGENHPACKELLEIELEMHTAQKPVTLRTVRNRLDRALEQLTAEAPGGLHPPEQKRVPGPANDSSTIEDFDPLTGLPGMVAAEKAIAEALEFSPARKYLCILSVERLKIVTLRYGQKTSDQLMLEFTQAVAEHFSGADRLFRWGGPTLVALVERGGRLVEVRSEMGFLASAKRDRVIEFQGQEQLLSISARSMVIALADCPSFDKILETLNTIASYSPA